MHSLVLSVKARGPTFLNMYRFRKESSIALQMRS